MDINIGKGITLDLDHTKLPHAVLMHVVKVGLRNVLMDCHAGITREDHPEDFRRLSEEKARAKWDAMLAGEVRVAREGKEKNPIATEALRLATARVTKIIGAKGQVKDEMEWERIAGEIPGSTPIEKREALIAAMAASADYVEKAREIIALRPVVPVLDLGRISFAR